MKPFINEDFLLGNKTAKKLFYEYSVHQPIIDFHCHLSPKMIAEDHQFDNIEEAWLKGDHYKWRAMRINGTGEKYCSGNSAPAEKFTKWAETIPAAVGNPLYHWTHLELARYFNIYDLLSPSTNQMIYKETSLMLRSKEFSTRSLIKKMNVRLICTTDDPVDPLQFHSQIKDSFDVSVLPTFRPDNIIRTKDPDQFKAYIEKLGESSGIMVKDFLSLLEALDNRHKFFNDHGCIISDHGLDRFHFAGYTENEIDRSLKKLLTGKSLTDEDDEKYKTAVLTELCRMNHRRSWTQQFHAGALRNNNARMFRLMGADTGWDSIGNSQDAMKMSAFFSGLDNSDQLAKTILYNSNPCDNEMMITMAGNFCDGTIPAKVQVGAPWWFLDQKNGIEKHLKDLASFGLLQKFTGMVTDSRSFLSFPRHEYFRRILCNYIGEEIEKGLIPDDNELIKPLIDGISYKNALHYLGIHE